MRASGLVALLLVSGCASASPDPYDLIRGKAPSLAPIIAEIDAAPSCTSEHIVHEPTMDSPIPVAMRRCPAMFPRELQRAGVEAACRSMFDLDDSGKPVSVVSHCSVGHVYTNLPEPWAAVAREAFAYATVSAVKRYIYPAVGDLASAGKWRSNLALGMRFQIEGEPVQLRYPPIYDRPAPAPPMTPEQQQFYAKLTPAQVDFHLNPTSSN